jgi:hypothetical protein
MQNKFKGASRSAYQMKRPFNEVTADGAESDLPPILPVAVKLICPNARCAGAVIGKVGSMASASKEFRSFDARMWTTETGFSSRTFPQALASPAVLLFAQEGSVVNLIRGETNAKIDVRDPVPGQYQRFILVSSPAGR